MFMAFLSLLLLCVLAVGRRVPKSQAANRHILECPPLLLQRAIFTSDIGKPHGSGFEQTNASVVQVPCAGIADCPGVPCLAAPCQLAPTSAVVADAELTREVLREHMDALDDIASSNRQERLAAERRAEEARVAQAAAEAALHVEEVATAAQSARASQAEEDRALAEVLAHDALQNETRSAEWDAKRLLDEQRASEELEAQKAIGDAAELAAETFINGTATYVGNVVRAGEVEWSAKELRARAADSSARAESYGQQAEMDAARSLKASQTFDDLQRVAQESAARAEALKARATELELEAKQAERSLEQEEQRLFDAREVANSFRESATDYLKRAAHEAVRNIENTSAQSLAHVEHVRDQVSREQVTVESEAERRARQTMRDILPNSRDFQVQNVLPLEVPQGSHE